MSNELLAIDRFICEANNFQGDYYENRFTGEKVYVPLFIIEAHWTCNVEHMIDKWHEAQRATDCHGWFNYFFCQMDTSNKEAMVDWILSNRERGYIH